MTLAADERYLLRQRYSKPVLENIKAALLEPMIIMLPQSRIGKAINYTLNHWDRVTRFLERGDLPIDNGVCERVIRNLAIGRKNWMHVMSDDGGKWMAILYSVIATCKLNNINPDEYLGDVLMRIAMRPVDASVRDLIPTEWLTNTISSPSPQTSLRPTIRARLTNRLMALAIISRSEKTCQTKTATNRWPFSSSDRRTLTIANRQTPLNKITDATMIAWLTVKNASKNSPPCSNYRYDDKTGFFVQVYFGKVRKNGRKATTFKLVKSTMTIKNITDTPCKAAAQVFQPG
jgi:hypothetical protein